MKDRIIFLGDVVTPEVANIIVAQMLFLEMEDADKDIHLYINSPGGSVRAGLAIYDIMQYIKCDVRTYCIGEASSMGSLLLATGTKGKRYILPNSRVMIHQPMAGIHGQVSDIEIHAKEVVSTKEKLTKIYQEHTGQKYAALVKDMDRDNFMSAEEAVKYGIVDRIITKKAKV